MQDNLKERFQKIIENGTEEELTVLEHILEGLDDKEHSYINRLLHMNYKITEDGLEIKIPLHPMVNNPLKILHGGITATVIDTAMGALVHQTLPNDKAGVTTQLNINYIAPGIGNDITCKAKISHHGSKTLLVNADVFRSDGQKIAQATGSFFIIERK
ncbi:PaaI family thioesterase [Robertmurraya sp. 2P01SA]|uniref:PaaI family thioesterase n=1 Tax=Robertmurraya sp. 2P01SA TaxID=3132300 RepID=UPI0039A67F41